MSTILTETTRTLYPEPAGGPVRMTVRVIGNGNLPPFTRDNRRPVAIVTTRCLPGAAWWSRPDGRTMRRAVDRALAGTGLVRDGRRWESTDGPVTEWRHTYPLTPGTTTHEETR